jgi:hypothetical protein
VIPSVVDPDPVGSELFAGCGINHFGPGSGQPLTGMNLKQNFSDKLTISQPNAQLKKNKNPFSQKNSLKIFHPKKVSLKSSSYKNISIYDTDRKY